MNTPEARQESRIALRHAAADLRAELERRGFKVKQIGVSQPSRSPALDVVLEGEITGDRLPVEWRADLARYMHRQRWIRWRNRIDTLLGWCGVPLDRRCTLADRIMDRLRLHKPKLAKIG